MRYHLLPRLSDVLFMAIFAGAVLLGQRMLNTDGDLGRHLVIGNYILDARRIPTHDILSWTRAGQSRPPYEWLAELLFALAYRAFNLDGAIVVTSLMIACAFLVACLDATERSQMPILALFITAWAALASSLHWLSRPHVFSFVLFALWVSGLERIRTGKNAPLRYLPLIMLFWANSHGGFVFGFLAWAVYVAGWIWDAGHRATTRSVGTGLLFVGVSALAASVVTPDLWNNWRAVLNNRSAFILSRTIETMAPDFSKPGFEPFAGLLALGVIFAALNRRRIAAAHVLLLAGFAVAGVEMARNIPFFAIASAPILVLWVKQAVLERSPWQIHENRVAELSLALGGAAWPLITVLATAGLFSLHWVQTRSSVYQFSPQLFPIGAADWIEANPPPGKMFNDFNWGGYLLYRVWPEERVFIDSQTDFYGEQLTREYEQIITLRGDWRASLSALDVHWMILPISSPLAEIVARDSSWRVLYRDDTAIIIAKRDSP